MLKEEIKIQMGLSQAMPSKANSIHAHNCINDTKNKAASKKPVWHNNTCVAFVE